MDDVTDITNCDNDTLNDICDVWTKHNGRGISAYIDDRWVPQIGPSKMVEACEGKFPVANLRISSKITTQIIDPLTKYRVVIHLENSMSKEELESHINMLDTVTNIESIAELDE